MRARGILEHFDRRAIRADIGRREKRPRQAGMTTCGRRGGDDDDDNEKVAAHCLVLRAPGAIK